MYNVIITGSTCLVGGVVLHRCPERTDVARLTAIVRKPTGRSHPKLVELVHPDMNDFTVIKDRLSGNTVAFHCIGVYTGAVPPDQFRRITVDQTIAFAMALRAASPEVVFCLLSGDGADRTGKSRIMFARDKGAAENGLVELGFNRLHCFRPGYIFPVEPRREPNSLYRFMRPLWKYFLSWAYPNGGCTSHQLADAMVKAGLDGSSKEVFSNRDIRSA